MATGIRRGDAVIDLDLRPSDREAAAERRARPSATGKERIVSLDGLRAIGLLLIMGFHFGIGGLPGGFLGVDLFYVLSGYLITGLLVGEYRGRGRIGLWLFWLRRARRLFPALLLVLVVTTVLVRFDAAPGLYPNFRMSALSSLFYFSNWWQIATSSNYFVATGPPSPLTHTWSLAVEEQFYLVWPIVVLAVLHLSRSFGRGLKVLLALSIAGVVASSLEMALRYHPAADTTRLYFGTDTHAQSVMVGAVLACVLTLVQWRRGADGMAPPARSRVARVAAAAVGVAGLLTLILLAEKLAGTDAFTYQGGILVAALASGALIVGSVCLPGGVLDRSLSWRPLVWIGMVSYGAYLWHYPVFVFLDTQGTGLTGFWLLAARVGATFAIAAASYYLIERPIMIGTFWRSLRAVGPALAGTFATVLVIVVGTTLPATASVAIHRYEAKTSSDGASSGAPPRAVFVLGDSLGVTLGSALVSTAPKGTTVTDDALYGCGLATGSWVSNKPPQPELAMFPACNEQTPASGQWPAIDATSLESDAPGDLVVFIAGTWEVQDILRQGQWTNITQPSFQRYELSQLRLLVRVATARGARLVLTTMPATAIGATFHASSSLPADSTTRHDLYDRLLREVAAEFPDKVEVLDLNAILSPGGVYHRYLDGVEIRTADGTHTPAYDQQDPSNPFANNSGPGVAEAFYNWLSPRIWPKLIAAANRGIPAGPGREDRSGGTPR